MDSDSHKAQRNSFAHHCAKLLFKHPEMQLVEPDIYWGPEPDITIRWIGLGARIDQRLPVSEAVS